MISPYPVSLENTVLCFVFLSFLCCFFTGVPFFVDEIHMYAIFALKVISLFFLI